MRKRVLFAIQGEGRGHMTQSLALKEILSNGKYDLVGAIIGKSSRRKIPDFVRERLDVEIFEIRSPNFTTDAQNKGLDIMRSITFNLSLLPKFYTSLKEIDLIIKNCRPDIVINFYEPLIGLYNRFFNPTFKTICIAHQYLTLHSGFKMPNGFRLERKSLQFFSALTSYKSSVNLGLSFYEMEDDRKNNVFVIPPLLRPEIRSLEVRNGDYILVYLLNKGYKSSIEEWHAKNKNIAIHCFSDDPDVEEELVFDETLTYHQLNGEKFLNMMSGCMALVSTAGFESVCEAMFLNKPVLMVPVKGHYEQFVNSRDAFTAGAGVYSEHFDIDKLMDYLKDGARSMDIFKNWANQADSKILRLINRVINE